MRTCQQGYDLQLIPMMVEGVPVMVQCLDFIVELLQQPLQHQQVFAVALTAELTSFYPDLPQSLTAAQQVERPCQKLSHDLSSQG